MNMRESKKIGLVEAPCLALFDEEDNNWTFLFDRNPLYGKQILAANLQAGGFNADIINLTGTDEREPFGEIVWAGRKLTKTMMGNKIKALDPDSRDLWGVTVNQYQEEEINCIAIQHLTSTGKPVVVGGSQAIVNPGPYLKAGASAVVLDKSGGANHVVLDHILGIPSQEELHGVILADGTHIPKQGKGLHPEEWPLPSLEVAKQCLGTQYTNSPWVEGMGPIGSCHSDIGCDQKCSFCQTPTYGNPYMKMSPKRVIEWLELQKQVGAKSIMMQPDQFLGRVLFKNGREEVLEIMQAFRELELAAMWCNGLELKKAAYGRKSHTVDVDKATIDEEFINALCGWDGKRGAILAYLPAERPTPSMGRANYRKLVPWQKHCEIVKAVVRAGVPIVTYGVIVGLPEDSHESLSYLEEIISELLLELKAINPSLTFHIGCYAISPVPGTLQEKQIRELGLLEYDDPCIRGGLWTPCANTLHLSHKEVSDWQIRLAQIGRSKDNLINYHGALTAVTNRDEV